MPEQQRTSPGTGVATPRDERAGTGPTVVVVSGPAVPAAAIPALRRAFRVVADATVPDEVAQAAGAERGEHAGEGEVLLTADPQRAGNGRAWRVPGGALLAAVEVMDRLRSPGGCPWDAKQTHRSLLQYLVEECYELYQAIEDDDHAAMREELGDVLLQVLFHARIASEAKGPGASQGTEERTGPGSRPLGWEAKGPGASRGTEERTGPGSRPPSDEHSSHRFDIDDVASDLVAKLVRRHPHVFARSEQVDSAATQELRWEELKRLEKVRESSVDGVPFALPAVALAAKLVSRATKAGLPVDLLPNGSDAGERLFALVAELKLGGTDPEGALRAVARRFAERVRAAERAAQADGQDPHALDAAAWRRYWPG